MTTKADKSGIFFGMSTIDCIYLVDDPPERNEKITAHQQLLCIGGPSSNAAITFSALGGKSTLISGLGIHPLATIAHQELKTSGVDHIDLCSANPTAPTVSAICVSKNNGDRSVVSINAKPIDPSNQDISDLSLTGYKTALFDGQYMELAIQLAKACRKTGIHTILDGGSWKPGTETLIHYIDAAICSAKFTSTTATTFNDTLAWLSDHNVGRAAITRGDQSILAEENGNRFEVFPPKPQIVRDTLAAGDIFHGAYAYYFAKSPDGGFRDHLKKSADIASKACAHFGPRTWIDDL